MKLPEPISTLGETVERLATEHPEDVALRAAGVTFTRGELAARARALSAAWRVTGLAPGDVVAIVGEGGLAFALALLSAARAGLVPLLLDPRTTPEEAQAVFERARPGALALCGIASVPFGEGLPIFRFDPDGCAALASGHSPPPLAADPHAAAVLLVTSGTSGHPRVVPLTAGNLSSNVRAGCEVHSCGRGEVFLSLLPATHAFELTTGLLGPLVCGAAVVYPGTRNPNRLLATAHAEGVTRVNVVPAILQMMAAEIRDTPEGRQVLHWLRGRLHSIVCGGAAAAPELVERVVHARLPLWLGYGLTEASPIVALGEAATLPRGSTGRPLPGVEVRVDESTGEVLVRGPNVMAGYHGDPEATAVALEAGWLRTGDLGRLDAEGHLFILGRKKDLIVTSGGDKLFPEEVEAAYRSPLFAELCAIGVPDAAGGGGQRPHLAAVPEPGSAGDEPRLRAEFARLSAAAGARRAYAMTLFTTPLPRTRSLKLRRDLVRRAVLERNEVPA